MEPDIASVNLEEIALQMTSSLNLNEVLRKGTGTLYLTSRISCVTHKKSLIKKIKTIGGINHAENAEINNK